MAHPTVVSYSRTYPAPVEQAFDSVLSMPLEQLFARRHGPIPAVRGTVANQPGWGAVGDSRTIQLADGGSLHEELTRVERPNAYGYELNDIHGPMKPLAARIDGLFTFAADGSGTRITWSWALYPRTLLSRPILPIFGRIWQGSARKAFDRIEAALPTG
jgi:hypothetical protein